MMYEAVPSATINRGIHLPKEVTARLSIASTSLILLVCMAVGDRHSWIDAAAVSVSVAVVQGAVRRILGLAVICLVPASFPPWDWPCYVLCLAPLGWMWRWPIGTKDGSVTARRAALEGLAIGFAAAWLSSEFLRDALWSRGWVLQSVACFAFGLQLAVVTVASCMTRSMGIGRAALVTATVSTLAEMIQAQWGVAWPVMGLTNAVAETPLVQWASLMGPFGVSWVLYVVNFLCVPNPQLHANEKASWGPLVSAGLFVVMWWGGDRIESSVPVSQPPFTALLAQPCVLENDSPMGETLRNLDRLTLDSLAEDGPVDLVIWPEGCVLPSAFPSLLVSMTDVPIEDRWDLDGARHKFRSRYQSTGLFGITLRRSQKVHRFGLEVDEPHLYNAAVLVDQSGATQVHEKQRLVPLKEGLPSLLDNPWFRRTVLPMLGQDAPMTAGDRYKRLEFTTRHGMSVRIAVCICYESLHPGLAQFSPTPPVDAIVHLLYDGHFVSHPEWIERHLMACRMRAIETRTWSFVCSSCAGSAIIDPCGRILGRRLVVPCVLRSDQLVQLSGSLQD